MPRTCRGGLSPWPGTLAATTIAGVAPAQTTGARNALAPPEPLLRLDNATDRVTLERFGQRIELSLGIYAIAGSEDFRIDAHRRS